MLWLVIAVSAQFHPADKYISVSSISGADIAQECAKDRGLVLDTCTSYILGVSDALQLARVT